jgi:hypothetical protein
VRLVVGAFAVLAGLLVASSTAFAAADVQLTKTISATTRTEESAGNFTHRYTWTNAGPDPAAGTVSVAVGPFGPSSITLSITGGGSSSLDSTDPVHPKISFSALAPAGVAYIELGFNTNHPGVERAVATAALTTPDPDPANNNGSGETEVTGLTASGSPAFGDVLLGASAATTVTLTNNAAVQFFSLGRSVIGPDPGDFSSPSSTCRSIDPAGSCEVAFDFTPSATGDRSAIAQLIPNSAVDRAVVSLSGRGTVPALPPAPAVLPDEAAPRVTFTKLPGSINLTTLLKRGLTFTEGGDEPAAFTNQLLTTARTATVRRGTTTVARAFNLVLAERSLPLAAGRRTVRLKPSRKLLGKSKRFKLRLVVTAKDAAGNTRAVTKTVKVRPPKKKR